MSEILRRYQVIIPYREPTYEKHRGSLLNAPYFARYKVTAGTEEAAVQNALMLFERDAVNSSVQWIRIPDYKNIKALLLNKN